MIPPAAGCRAQRGGERSGASTLGIKPEQYNPCHPTHHASGAAACQTASAQILNAPPFVHPHPTSTHSRCPILRKTFSTNYLPKTNLRWKMSKIAPDSRCQPNQLPPPRPKRRRRWSTLSGSPMRSRRRRMKPSSASSSWPVCKPLPPLCRRHLPRAQRSLHVLGRPRRAAPAAVGAGWFRSSALGPRVRAREAG